MRKITWFSALPERCCPELLEKIESLSPEERRRRDCKVVIDVGAKSRPWPQKPKPTTPQANPNEFCFSIRRLASANSIVIPRRHTLGARTLAVPVPHPSEPRFRVRPTLLSRG